MYSPRKSVTCVSCIQYVAGSLWILFSRLYSPMVKGVDGCIFWQGKLPWVDFSGASIGVVVLLKFIMVSLILCGCFPFPISFWDVMRLSLTSSKWKYGAIFQCMSSTHFKKSCAHKMGCAFPTGSLLEIAISQGFLDPWVHCTSMITLHAHLNIFCRKSAETIYSHVCLTSQLPVNILCSWSW